jgi:hypothetical protein
LYIRLHLSRPLLMWYTTSTGKENKLFIQNQLNIRKKKKEANYIIKKTCVKQQLFIIKVKELTGML